jgi:hypothetical protein
MLQGCAPQPVQRAAARVYAVDLAGAAKSCTVPKIALEDGQAAEVAMAVGNDGGWCGITVAQKGPTPYAAGLLTARPAHGKVYVHTVGDVTRIDYTPDPSFTGKDGFTVTLLPGQPVLRVDVAVKPG